MQNACKYLCFSVSRGVWRLLSWPVIQPSRWPMMSPSSSGLCLQSFRTSWSVSGSPSPTVLGSTPTSCTKDSTETQVSKVRTPTVVDVTQYHSYFQGKDLLVSLVRKVKSFQSVLKLLKTFWKHVIRLSTMLCKLGLFFYLLGRSGVRSDICTRVEFIIYHMNHIVYHW